MSDTTTSGGGGSGSRTYTGPSVAEMIRNHTLAHNIMTRHDTMPPEERILGADDMAILRRFVCADDLSAERTHIIHEHDLQDEEGVRPGERAANVKGTLAGFCVVRHGMAGEGTAGPALTDGEIGDLKGWFERGGGM